MPKKPLENFDKYTSMVFKMAAVIFIGVYAGMKIDQYIKIKFPVFTILLSLVSVGISIYILVRDTKN